MSLITTPICKPNDTVEDGEVVESIPQGKAPDAPKAKRMTRAAAAALKVAKPRPETKPLSLHAQTMRRRSSDSENTVERQKIRLVDVDHRTKTTGTTAPPTPFQTNRTRPEPTGRAVAAGGGGADKALSAGAAGPTQPTTTAPQRAAQPKAATNRWVEGRARQAQGGAGVSPLHPTTSQAAERPTPLTRGTADSVAQHNISAMREGPRIREPRSSSRSPPKLAGRSGAPAVSLAPPMQLGAPTPTPVPNTTNARTPRKKPRGPRRDSDDLDEGESKRRRLQAPWDAEPSAGPAAEPEQMKPEELIIPASDNGNAAATLGGAAMPTVASAQDDVTGRPAGQQTSTVQVPPSMQHVDMLVDCVNQVSAADSISVEQSITTDEVMSVLEQKLQPDTIPENQTNLATDFGGQTSAQPGTEIAITTMDTTNVNTKPDEAHKDEEHVLVATIRHPLKPFLKVWELENTLVNQGVMHYVARRNAQIRTADGEFASRLINCPFCLRGYDYMRSFLEHVKSHSEWDASKVSWNCPCGKHFANQHGLAVHAASCTAPYNYTGAFFVWKDPSRQPSQAVPSQAEARAPATVAAAQCAPPGAATLSGRPETVRETDEMGRDDEPTMELGGRRIVEATLPYVPRRSLKPDAAARHSAPLRATAEPFVPVVPVGEARAAPADADMEDDNAPLVAEVGAIVASNQPRAAEGSRPRETDTTASQQPSGNPTRAPTSDAPVDDTSMEEGTHFTDLRRPPSGPPSPSTPSSSGGGSMHEPPDWRDEARAVSLEPRPPIGRIVRIPPEKWHQLIGAVKAQRQILYERLGTHDVEDIDLAIKLFLHDLYEILKKYYEPRQPQAPPDLTDPRDAPNAQREGGPGGRGLTRKQRREAHRKRVKAIQDTVIRNPKAGLRWLYQDDEAQRAQTGPPLDAIGLEQVYQARRRRAPPARAFVQLLEEKYSRAPPAEDYSELLAHLPRLRPEDSQPLGLEVDVREVRRVMKKCGNTAAGADGLSYNVWKSIFVLHQSLADIVNAILRTGRVPECLRVTRLTMIFKKGDPSAAANYRPIALQCNAFKMVSAILAARFGKWCTDNRLISPSQKGFVPVRGCLEHLFVAEDSRKQAFDEKLTYNVVQYDLKDAYGCVPLEYAREVLRTLQVPQPIIDIYCHQANCRLLRVNGSPRSVPQRRGVAQGDPLSPLMFNLCMEPLLRRLQSLKASGYATCLGGPPFNVLAYADDIRVMQNNPSRMVEANDIVNWFLVKAGLTANVGKCKHQSIRKVDGRVQNVDVPEQYRLRVQGQLVPLAQLDEQMNYLGRDDDPLAPTSTTINGVLKQLARRCWIVARSCLEPVYKFMLIKRHILPSVVYHIQSCTTNVKVMQDFDRRVRAALKHSLRLPSKSSSGFVHSPVPDGGLGVEPLDDVHRKLRCSAALYLLNSPDPEIRHAARLGAFVAGRPDEPFPPDPAELLTEALSHLNHCVNDNARAASRTTERRLWNQLPLFLGQKGVQLRAGPDGEVVAYDRSTETPIADLCAHFKRAHKEKYLNDWSKQKAQGWTTKCQDPIGNRYLFRPQKLSPWQLTTILKAKIGMLPLNARRAKFEPSIDKMCRLCRQQEETLCHLGGCSDAAMRNAVQNRHNQVVKAIEWAVNASDQPINAHETRHAEVLNCNLHPDLVITDAEKRTIHVLDVTVRHQTSPEYLRDCAQQKTAKYAEAWLPGYALLHPNSVLRFHPIVIGDLGHVPSDTLKALNACGLTEKHARAVAARCSLLAAKGTVWMINLITSRR